MGNGGTKENQNVYFRARKQAAMYNERLSSREGAAEMLGISPSTLADYELGITKFVPVDKVVLMADLYNCPELRTGYCKYECPIGKHIPLATSVSGIEGIALRLAKDCVEAASNVEEMENKFNVVFGDMADEVDKWAEQFADSVGRNKNTIKTYLADQQNLLVGFGMTREEGSKLSEQMTTLALDIASFSNQDEDVAVNAMTKAVMGESEAAKTLGAVLNDTTRAETMAALGMSGTYDSLSQLEKMQVNYNAILRQSPDAVGDCVRSMGSYESSTRQLKAAQEEFKEFIGGQLLPVMSVFVQWVTKGVKAATKFAKAILLDADGNNRILRSFDRIHAVVKRLQPAMERFTSSMKNGINKATDTIKNIINRFGGMENAMKMLAIIAGAFIIAMNWSKIIGGAKAFLSLIQGMQSSEKDRMNSRTLLRIRFRNSRMKETSAKRVRTNTKSCRNRLMNWNAVTRRKMWSGSATASIPRFGLEITKRFTGSISRMRFQTSRRTWDLNFRRREDG